MNTLTNEQYYTLVQPIASTILNSNDDFGMGEMGECYEMAEYIVTQWAETNNITLP